MVHPFFSLVRFLHTDTACACTSTRDHMRGSSDSFCIQTDDLPPLCVLLLRHLHAPCGHRRALIACAARDCRRAQIGHAYAHAVILPPARGCMRCAARKPLLDCRARMETALATNARSSSGVAKLMLQTSKETKCDTQERTKTVPRATTSDAASSKWPSHSNPTSGSIAEREETGSRQEFRSFSLISASRLGRSCIVSSSGWTAFAAQRQRRIQQLAVSGCRSSSSAVHIMTHLHEATSFAFSCFFSEARIASEKTSVSFSCVSALHSTYAAAPMSFASA